MGYYNRKVIIRDGVRINSSIISVSESIIASLAGNVDVYSPVCDSKIRTIDDGIDAVEVCFVKTRHFFPSMLGGGEWCGSGPLHFWTDTLLDFFLLTYFFW